MERERYRQAFLDLLEVAEDMRSYVPEYFATKWRHDEQLSRAREFVKEFDREEAQA